MNIKQLKRETLKDISFLDNINHIKTNPYSNINQIEKHYNCIDNEKIFLYGLYDNNNINCLTVLEKNKCSVDDCFILSIECFVSGKNYGLEMIHYLYQKHDILHWMCDPTANKKLYQYYHNLGLCNEYIITRPVSIYNLTTIFFYKCSDINKRKKLFEFYRQYQRRIF